MLSSAENAEVLNQDCLTTELTEGSICTYQCHDGYAIRSVSALCNTQSNSSVMTAAVDNGGYCSNEQSGAVTLKCFSKTSYYRLFFENLVLLCVSSFLSTNKTRNSIVTITIYDITENDDGYETVVHLSCSSDGKWSASEPDCGPLCPPLSYPKNGFVRTSIICLFYFNSLLFNILHCYDFSV